MDSESCVLLFFRWYNIIFTSCLKPAPLSGIFRCKLADSRRTAWWNLSSSLWLLQLQKKKGKATHILSIQIILRGIIAFLKIMYNFVQKADRPDNVSIIYMFVCINYLGKSKITYRLDIIANVRLSKWGVPVVVVTIRRGYPGVNYSKLSLWMLVIL